MLDFEQHGQDVGDEFAYAGAFAAALLDPDHATPSAVAGPKGKTATKRYNVYRNNVTVSLIDALADDLPGDAAHHRRRISFARWHASMSAPRRRPRRFCSNMAATFPISSNATNMRGRCRGWRMWRGSSGHGSTPITRRTRNRWTHRPWRPFPPDRLAATIWTPHPATRIVRSRFPAVAIFAANRSDGPVGRIEATEPEDALVTRPALEVIVRRLPPGGARLPDTPHRRRNARRNRRGGARRQLRLRPSRHHRRHARGGRLHRNSSRRLRRWLRNGRPPPTTDGMGLAASSNGRTRSFAPLRTPSLTQLVLRFGLAIPFWRSGVNKWDGFLQLNDIAVLLFSSEFKLHLPGGPYPFPAPAAFAFAAGSAEILLPILLVLGLGDAIGCAGPSGDDAGRAADRAGWLAAARDLGSDGARHHGVGAGATFAGPRNRPAQWPQGPTRGRWLERQDITARQIDRPLRASQPRPR